MFASALLRRLGVLTLLALVATVLSLATTVAGASAQQTELWVSVAGSDNGDGSAQNPFATIQHAVNQAEPGTTVSVLPGVYSEAVRVRTSGSAFAPIVIRSSTPGGAIVDGTGLSNPTAFTVNAKHWVTIDGFEIRNFTSTGVWELAGGFYIAGAASNIAITNNEIHSIAGTHPNQPIANAIGVYGTRSRPMTDITISGNDIHDLILGWSEAVVVNGNVDGFDIDSNTIYNIDNIGIDAIGYESWLENGGVPAALNRARNGTIRNNHVFGIDSSTNPVYQGEKAAGGIYVDGGTDITITDNVVHNNNIGIELASEAPGGFTDNILLADNEIWNNELAGLAIGGYQAGLGTTRNITVEYNSFYNNATFLSHAAGEIWFQHNVMDNTIRNNIVHAGNAQILVSDLQAQFDDNTIDGNIWSANMPGAFHQFGATQRSETQVDPEYFQPTTGDLRLSSTSPAVAGNQVTHGRRTADAYRGPRIVDAAPVALTASLTSSCMSDNGRVDIALVNAGSAVLSATANVGRIQRTRSVPAGSNGSITVTGRPDGPMEVTVTSNGQTLLSETVIVDCDPEPTGEVAIRVSCLGNNGRVDVDLFNDGTAAAEYAVMVGSVGPRLRTLQPGATGMVTVTGRADGPLVVDVKRVGVTILSSVETIDCDGAGFNGVVVFVSCVAGNGQIDVTVFNAVNAPATYEVYVGSVGPRQTAFNGGPSSRIRVTGRADGTYDVVTYRAGLAVDTQNVTVACDLV